MNLRNKMMMLVATATLTGCVLAPGQHAGGDRYWVADNQQWDSELTTVPITATLLRSMETENGTATGATRTYDRSTWTYRIGPHDVLSIVIWGHPELTIPAGEFRSAAEAGHKVAADGTMFFPHIGVLQVAGKTIPEVRAELARRLADFIQSPQVDVRVAAFNSQRVHVAGQVTQPSVLPISDIPMSLFDAVHVAGGPTVEADLQRVTLTRDGTQRVFNLQALVDYGDLSQDCLLQDGDIIHVPDRALNRVYVLGEIRRPQSLQMHRGRMTLAEAIGRTEGFDQNAADPSRLFVLRGDLNQPVIYALDASAPDALLLAERFQLMASDVVFVATSDLTRWNRVISQITPTLISLREAERFGQ